MAVDLSVLTKHINEPSIEFVLKDREEAYKTGPETPAGYLFSPTKVSGGTEIPFELHWYVDQEIAMLKYRINVMHQFALSCVSIEDYVTLADIFILKTQRTVEEL